MVLKEQQQLRMIRRGEIGAFESLFHQYYGGLCSYAESLVRDRNVAEEVVQDVFYNIWKNREALRIHKGFKSYIFRSVYNTSMMHLRKYRKEYPWPEDRDLERESDEADPMKLMQLDEVSGLIERTLGQLPDRTREVFLLNRQEGLKYREIAERLSISVKTVEADMGKALRALRLNLNKYEQEERN